MKVSKEQAGQNRDALLDAASRMYRQFGFDGVGVAQIAREAGLTHGSLYGHFESKDHFSAEACDQAFEGALDLVRVIEPGDDRALAAFFKHYLSERHRDTPATGCPIAALAADAARKEGPVAQSMTQGIEAFVKLFAERFADTSSNAAASRERAMSTLAMLVGGVVLARACASTNARASKQMLNAALNSIAKQANGEVV